MSKALKNKVKLNDIVSVKDFGADPTAAIVAALAAYNVVNILQPITFGAFTVPAGKTIIATGVAITCTATIALESNTKIIGGTWTFLDGGFASDGASTITYQDCDIVTNASASSAALHQNGSHLICINTNMTSANRNGLYTDAMEHVVVEGGRYNASGRNGILLTGGTEHVINPYEASRNGTGGIYSGVNVSRCSKIKIGSPLCYGNEEHGISLQDVSDFDVEFPVCVNNGLGGISLQDDGTALTPCERGSIGGIFNYNDEGIRFLDTNQNIVIKAGTCAQENTSYQVRMRDLASSGRKSDNIIAKGCNFRSTVGAIFTNSNASTNINITDKNNSFRQFTGEKKSHATLAIVSGALTYENDPSIEMYYVTGGNTADSAFDIARFRTAGIIDGMRLTLFAVNAFRCRHNSTGANLAHFILTSAATTTVAANTKIEFIAYNNVWYQV